MYNVSWFENSNRLLITDYIKRNCFFIKNTSIAMTIDALDVCHENKKRDAIYMCLAKLRADIYKENRKRLK